jgi:hypothetical protein
MSSALFFFSAGGIVRLARAGFETGSGRPRHRNREADVSSTLLGGNNQFYRRKIRFNPVGIARHQSHSFRFRVRADEKSGCGIFGMLSSVLSLRARCRA